VHHIDGNASNDAPENLAVMTRGDHSKHHAHERKQSESIPAGVRTDRGGLEQP
jgi:hypothetical protein